jgi:hypothetical protein
MQPTQPLLAVPPPLIVKIEKPQKNGNVKIIKGPDGCWNAYKKCILETSVVGGSGAGLGSTILCCTSADCATGCLTSLSMATAFLCLYSCSNLSSRGKLCCYCPDENCGIKK